MSDVGNRIYREAFSDWENVRIEFSQTYGEPDPDIPAQEPKFVFAAYEQGSYDGDAVVIFSDDGVAFNMVAGSHCSCFGLEGQWSPDETTVEAIRHMITKGRPYGVNETHAAEILSWLERVKP